MLLLLLLLLMMVAFVILWLMLLLRIVKSAHPFVVHLNEQPHEVVAMLRARTVTGRRCGCCFATSTSSGSGSRSRSSSSSHGRDDRVAQHGQIGDDTIGAFDARSNGRVVFDFGLKTCG